MLTTFGRCLYSRFPQIPVVSGSDNLQPKLHLNVTWKSRIIPWDCLIFFFLNRTALLLCSCWDSAQRENTNVSKRHDGLRMGLLVDTKKTVFALLNKLFLKIAFIIQTPIFNLLNLLKCCVLTFTCETLWKGLYGLLLYRYKDLLYVD